MDLKCPHCGSLRIDTIAWKTLNEQLEGVENFECRCRGCGFASPIQPTERQAQDQWACFRTFEEKLEASLEHQRL